MQTSLSLQNLSGSLSFRDALKVRNRTDVGQSAPEVCGLISAGPGGAGDAGKQGGAGMTESEEEPEILNINVSYCGAGSPSTNNRPLVDPDLVQACVQQEHHIPHQEQNVQKPVKAAFSRLGDQLQELVSVSLCGAAEVATL